MDPSWCMGVYPPVLGKGPLYQVVSPPDCALPPLMAYVVVPLFLTMAVTKVLLLPRLFGLLPLPPANSPFSISAMTQGPEPAERPEVDGVHGAVAIVVPICFGVAVVETAATVDKRGAGHHVCPLRLGTSGYACSVVDSVAHPRSNLDPVDDVTGDIYGQGHGVRSQV